MFGFGSGGDGSDEHFFKGAVFIDALKLWYENGGTRFIVQGERNCRTMGPSPSVRKIVAAVVPRAQP